MIYWTLLTASWFFFRTQGPQTCFFLTYSQFKSFPPSAVGEFCPCRCMLIYLNCYLLGWFSAVTLTITVWSCSSKILTTVSKKTPLKVWKKQKQKRKKHCKETLNRCLDLCYKHSTNHLPHPSLWSAAPLVCKQPISGCKFPSQILRISWWTLVRGCEETCSVLPGHCASVHVSGGEAAVRKVRVQRAYKASIRFWLDVLNHS